MSAGYVLLVEGFFHDGFKPALREPSLDAVACLDVLHIPQNSARFRVRDYCVASLKSGERAD